MKKIEILSFTDKGQNLADNIALALKEKGLEAYSSRCRKPLSLAEWTAKNFNSADGLIFVGAMGIAVRAIAPYIVNKTQDPAVVVIDERGNNAVSVLSGHLGGGNELTNAVAKITAANPVITTATDVEGIFAIDLWTKRNRCKILEANKIKLISAALLANKAVRFDSDYPIRGKVPDNVELTSLSGGAASMEESANKRDLSEKINADVLISASQKKIDKASEKTLIAVPKFAYLGVGCRRGINSSAVESCFEEFMRDVDVSKDAITLVCSIDLKKEEKGLIEFCKNHNLDFETFSAEKLSALEGDFSSSDFVRGVTGVDNVCERSAIYGSGGKLIKRKWAKNGVTMALAIAPFSLDWSWKND